MRAPVRHASGAGDQRGQRRGLGGGSEQVLVQPHGAVGAVRLRRRRSRPQARIGTQGLAAGAPGRTRSKSPTTSGRCATRRGCSTSSTSDGTRTGQSSVSTACSTSATVRRRRARRRSGAACYASGTGSPRSSSSGRPRCGRYSARTAARRRGRRSGTCGSGASSSTASRRPTATSSAWTPRWTSTHYATHLIEDGRDPRFVQEPVGQLQPVVARDHGRNRHILDHRAGGAAARTRHLPVGLTGAPAGNLHAGALVAAGSGRVVRHLRDRVAAS